jgi:OmpA-OmpF porin, OOP family
METWAEIWPINRGISYYVRIIERQVMQQQVTANADAMQAGLTQYGHVEVPGILFDFNKADIKPESEPALQEVAKLLKANPGIRVWVVGHTDYVGAADKNVALANARAASVVKALTQKHGIDVKRLSPYGVGPYAPVASNTSEEGRAKNRRVELVVQPAS